MKIEKIKSSTSLPDGRIRIEYYLSSPVTKEVLSTLSRGNWTCTGRQYLSPAFVISKSHDIEIHGIIKSPVIVLYCSSGSESWIEDYLIEFFSTIPDSEEVESPIQKIFKVLASRFRI